MNHPFFVDGSAFLSDTGVYLISSNARAVALLCVCFVLLRSADRSASTRHLLVSSALAGLLLLPVITLAIPAIDIVVRVAVEDLVTMQTAQAGSAIAHARESWTQDSSRYATLLTLLYVSGVLFNLARQVWRNLMIALVSWIAQPVGSRDWLDGLLDAKQQLGVRRNIDLRYSRFISSPVTWGAFRPVVLVPASARFWPRQLIASALLHELAHIRRCDWPVQQFARLACAFYWANPLSWWALRRLEDDAESASDDLVLNTGIDGYRYAGDLLHVARQVCQYRSPSAAMAMSLSSKPSQLARRVKSILDPVADRARHDRFQSALTAGFVTLVLLPLVSLRTNYVEVPVFAPGALVRLSGSSLPSAAPELKISDLSERRFDKEAVKRAAVTDLQMTLAEVNASTREWLYKKEKEVSEERGRKLIANDSLRDASQVPRFQELAIHSSKDESFVSKTGAAPEAGTSGTSDFSKTQDPTPAQDRFPHKSRQPYRENPLLALVRNHQQARLQQAGRYAHKRIVKPRYPSRAISRGIEGEVVVTFKIDKKGRVVNPRILKARPAGIFDEPVLRAVEQFRYQPNLLDGRPVAIESAREVFRFVLES